jgi:hypothetical protein
MRSETDAEASMSRTIAARQLAACIGTVSLPTPGCEPRKAWLAGSLGCARRARRSFLVRLRLLQPVQAHRCGRVARNGRRHRQAPTHHRHRVQCE